jgi:polyisoprenyl-phosphate glycosyltransferase
MSTLAHDDPRCNRPAATDATEQGAKHASMDTHVRYSVIIPVYNEQQVLPVTYERLKTVMDGLREPYELVFVNDGSSDASQAILESLSDKDNAVKVINFSRNFGHQVAISAGMDYAAGDAVIVIDADLQDPPELIPKMIERWSEGYQVVYARRTVRLGETQFKRWSAAFFYRMLRTLTDFDIPVDTGDFRLIDRRVCEVMKSIHEKNRFIRGLVSWSGFRQTAVEYVREPRLAGETKYSLKKMLRLSSDAITSFSDKPLKLPIYIGSTLIFLCTIFLVYAVFASISFRHAISGLLWVVYACAMLNAIVLLSLGIMGQYIARIYDEVRNRPLYVVVSQKGFQKESLPGGR